MIVTWPIRSSTLMVAIVNFPGLVYAVLLSVAVAQFLWMRESWEDLTAAFFRQARREVLAKPGDPVVAAE